ncbi:TetR/AcrR family transcriptional regulator [Clostridium estertheticum]|uniref:TetR/AcrR family transcriptional regulator n=1 Tax=Clostridium estertheticum TaxID=238834 RepID=UPI0013E930D3|nr:TetR/AcrR family transcriptional regulator [Clostridium estertheticum]MBZ9689603.1 TetR/AcrR family transcriptional regulator [Clostridium estertheticum]
MPKVIENLRETIILEAKKILLTQGFKDLNIREIAKGCTIGTGTFYNYFSTKEDLVAEIFREDWKKVSNLVDELKHTEEPCKEKIRKIYVSIGMFVNSYIPIFYEMAMLNGNDYRCREANRYDVLYIKISELLDIEKSKGTVHSTLSSYKLAELIVSNLMYINKNKFISFDELYDNLKI